MNPLLELKGISKSFGGLKALDDLDLTINQGDIFGLIGPNGSGKTTLLNVITGFLTPESGRVVYRDHNITGLKPFLISALGAVRTFQITSIFSGLSAVENVVAGCYLKTKGSVFGSLFKTKTYLDQERKLLKKATDLLEFLEMDPHSRGPASDLPAVDQRKLEIAIALACEPDLLLLDEPAAGMNPEEQDHLIRHIRALHDSGVTIVLVEHNMRVVSGICNRLATLNFGRKLAEGATRRILSDDRVISLYLGKRSWDAQG